MRPRRIRNRDSLCAPVREAPGALASSTAGCALSAVIAGRPLLVQVDLVSVGPDSPVYSAGRPLLVQVDRVTVGPDPSAREARFPPTLPASPPPGAPNGKRRRDRSNRHPAQTPIQRPESADSSETDAAERQTQAGANPSTPRGQPERRQRRRDPQAELAETRSRQRTRSSRRQISKIRTPGPQRRPTPSRQGGHPPQHFRPLTFFLWHT